MAEQKEYKIPAENWTGLQADIEKLNRRADKLGCERIVLTVLRTVDEPSEWEDVWENGRSVAKPVAFVRIKVVTVQGKAPVLNGWAFVGTLQHIVDDDKKEQTILRAAPNETIPDKYRTATSEWCDHCQTRRYRIDTFVVRKEETGEYKQVGRQCLKDFLGYNANPDQLANWAQTIASIDGMMEAAEERGGGHGGHGARFLGLEYYLSYVAKAIRERGWVSRSKAREDAASIATADLASAFMETEHDDRASPDKRAAAKFNEKDVELAKTAIEWTREALSSMETSNDYEHNLRVVVSMQAIDGRMTGIAASLIVYYQKRTQQQVNYQNSSWFGAIGDRATFTLMVDRVIPHEKQAYGRRGTAITYIHKMRDENGNLAVWFSSGTKLEEGETYELVGTVKDHKEYRGVKETILTRCKIAGSERKAKKEETHCEHEPVFGDPKTEQCQKCGATVQFASGESPQ